MACIKPRGQRVAHPTLAGGVGAGFASKFTKNAPQTSSKDFVEAKTSSWIAAEVNKYLTNNPFKNSNNNNQTNNKKKVHKEKKGK